MRTQVDKELERLQEQAIIEPVQFSDWAEPIVPIAKKDWGVRLCGDYKLKVNQASKLDTYPLPRIEDLFASLASGKYFTKLDLAQAYLQLPLDEESKKFTTNTLRRVFFAIIGYHLAWHQHPRYSSEQWELFCKVSLVFVFT